MLTWLFVAACVFADIAILGETFVQKYIWPGPAGVVGLGLALGQMSILIAWMIWGKWNVMLRVMLATCGAFGIGWLAAISTVGSQRPDLGEWIGALLVYLVVLAIPLGIARATAYRIVVGDVAEEPTAADDRSWQFSIWSLLSAMTAVAVMLGVLQYADWLHEGFFNALMFFIVLSTNTVITLFATFKLRRRWIAAPFVLVTSTIAGLLLQLAGHTVREDWLALIAMSCVHGLTVFACVLVLKVAGYQLQRGAAVTKG